MNHYDHSRAALSLEPRDLALAGGLEHALLQVRLNGGQHEEKPEQRPNEIEIVVVRHLLSPAPDG
ncbi:MAG: hypothetical protein WB580_09495 [Candidatus Binataceae bacterium]